MERLLALRPVRWGGVAAVPGLWLAIAWVDWRMVAFALLCGLGTAGFIRELDKRRPPRDDELIL
jgi:hypothetical protein